MHNKKHYLARRYMFNKYDANCQLALDMPVRFSEGDIFLGLDFTINQHPHLAEVLSEVRQHGAKIYLLLYDLLPIALPSTFYKEVVVNFKLWLEAAVSVADGMICISRTVADELLVWLDKNPPKRSTPLDIGYFHLGSSLSEQDLSTPPLSSQPIGALKNNSRQTVLMVGTIEPRKGYAQVLSAFELIWNTGLDVNLVIVGREGWLVDDLVDNMTHHPEYNKRFYWLNDADDTALDELYRHSTVLLAASEGEGFGLPIVEAARRGTPVIVRDIPVFREVAGDGGFYFTGKSAERLAEKVQEWFSLHATGNAPKPQLVTTFSWQESSSQLYEIILHGNWYQRWSGL
jgi:glycosyltransferase involved in cell wall biosynthesis